jgi:hypothetical protein
MDDEVALVLDRQMGTEAKRQKREVYSSVSKTMSTEMHFGHPEKRIDGACQSMKEDVVYLYTHYGCCVTLVVCR